MSKVDSRLIDFQSIFAPTIADNQKINIYVNEEMTPYKIKGNNILPSGKSVAYYENDILPESLLASQGAGIHNSFYRGDNLGEFSSQHSQAIAKGSFDNLFIGDYFPFTNLPYSYTDENGQTQNDLYSGNIRIAHFDYWLLAGRTAVNSHHILVIPDTPMFNAKMNDGSYTNGGFYSSKMFNTHLKRAEAIFKAAFGASHLLRFFELFTTAFNTSSSSPNIPTSTTWDRVYTNLMNEFMIYGARFFAVANDGTNVPVNSTVACKQLNLFKFRPDLISYRNSFWLNDIVSKTAFAKVNNYGNPDYADIGTSLGVRPFALLY